MISLIPALTSSKPEDATIADIIKHILHAGAIVGFEHVGIGSDFDGMPNTVAGLEDVSKFAALVAAMLDEGITMPIVERIIGRNLIEVFRKIEEEWDRLQQIEHVAALEDDVKPMWSAELKNWCKRQWPEADK